MSNQFLMSEDAIAIAGIGCRFPGNSNDPESFWDLLSRGVDAVDYVPKDRWNMEVFYHPERNRQSKTSSCRGGFLNNIDQFDAAFFGISPREAMHMDPQQRLMMEVCWEAFEDAGQVVKDLAGKQVGVFTGAFTMDHQIFMLKESNKNKLDSSSSTGIMMTLIANRISHAFDLRGPSVAIDTACSSSLVAVHMACQSIRNGECNIAVAGGVNIMFMPDFNIVESKAGMLSPDGKCKTWDASANGYVRCEGAGVVILKPLSQALEDKDRIYAVIRGSSVNQDGHTQGITVPSGEAQKAVMRSAYEQAGVSPDMVGYMEAHGTGTPVGDPIEVNAIGSVLSARRSKNNPCFIGSVKTNFGHAEAAAGIAGLIKSSLILYHRKIPPHLNLHEVNPDIDFDALHLKVPTRLTTWPDKDKPAYAAVNSFGFGGTNAHVVLEEASHPKLSSDNNDSIQQPILLPLSARSPESLNAMVSAVGKIADADISSYDIGYTYSRRRDHHNHRLAVVAGSKKELLDQLKSFTDKDDNLPFIQGQVDGDTRPTLVFVFTGMGPQWWAMGRQLLEQYPLFRKTVDDCDRVFKSLAGYSIIEEMLKDESSSRMEETEISQPANFVLQVGLAALWSHWGIQPDAIVGHSTGEVAAAYTSGALTLEDAVKVIYHRSRLQQLTTGKGKLMAVGMSLQDIKTLLKCESMDTVSIAAINSPNAVTVAASQEELERLSAILQKNHIFNRTLKVNVPYHSHFMETIHEELLISLQDVKGRETDVPLYSSVTGELIDGLSLDNQYWWLNVREPVRFAKAITSMEKAGYKEFIELGPHPVLASSIQECITYSQVVTSLRRETDETITLLTTLGYFYTKGYAIDWTKLYSDTGQIVPLHYPWQHQQYWIESAESEQLRVKKVDHRFLGHRLNQPVPTWDGEIDLYRLPYLQDHQVQGAIVFPGVAYLEMALSAGQLMNQEIDTPIIENLTFHQALFLSNNQAKNLRTVVDPENGHISIYNYAEQAPWPLLASGQIRPNVHKKAPVAESIAEIKKRCHTTIDKTDCYTRFRNIGLEYGETFTGIEALHLGNNEILAQVKIPESLTTDLSSYLIHPTVSDLCLQSLAGIITQLNNNKPNLYLPVDIKQCQLFTENFDPETKQPLWIHATIKKKSDLSLCGDVLLTNNNGQTILHLKSCHLLSPKSNNVPDNDDFNIDTSSVYELSWTPISSPLKEKSTIIGQKSWLVFMDDNGLGENLCQELESQNHQCFRVFSDKKFRVIHEQRRFYLDPKSDSDFDQLFTEVDDTSFAGVIFLWPLDNHFQDNINIDQLDVMQKTLCFSALNLLQALDRYKQQASTRLWLVTRGTQNVDLVAIKTSPLNSPAAALWGLARVAGHREYVNIWGGIIDLDPVPSPSTNETLTLIDEILFRRQEDQLAIRKDQCYALRLFPKAIEKPSVLPVSFASDVSYLITGGLGGLGLIVAKWLILRGARHIILMGRTYIPPRSQWNELDEDLPLCRKITEIQKLEAMGATIHLASVDVSDENELTNYFKHFKQAGWPPVRGIIHAAGLADPQPIVNMSHEDFYKVLKPKMTGAWLLHRHFETEPLEFFIMFSSVASVIAMDGQANYAAGNAFMDTLAHYRRSRGLPALSLNWGSWAGSGLAADLGLLAYFSKRGVYSINPDQGIKLLEQAIASDATQLTLLKINWKLLSEWYPMNKVPPMILSLLDNNESSQKAEDLSDDDVMTQYSKIQSQSGRHQLIEGFLISTAGAVLRMDASSIDPNRSLIELGIDSMMAAELRNYIEKTLTVNITFVDILKGSSIRQLTDQCLSELSLIKQDASPVDTGDEELTSLMNELSKLTDDDKNALLTEVEQAYNQN